MMTLAIEKLILCNKRNKIMREEINRFQENITKKKNTEKKKSNLELFKEELEQ